MFRFNQTYILVKVFPLFLGNIWGTQDQGQLQPINMDARSYLNIYGNSTGSRFCASLQGIINVQVSFKNYHI